MNQNSYSTRHVGPQRLLRYLAQHSARLHSGFRPLLVACLLVLALPLASPVFAGSQQTLLVFGDSLSAAYRMDEQAGWVALLEEKVEQEGLAYRVVNASVSGETTSGGLARLPAVLQDHQPDIVVLELGGNDGLRGIPVANIRANLLRMIDMIEAEGASVVLAGIQIPPNYGPRYTEPFTRQYAEIAQERGLVLVPFILEGIPDDVSLMQDDGIHPKAEAQPLVLENVWPHLAPLLGSARTPLPSD